MLTHTLGYTLWRNAIYIEVLEDSRAHDVYDENVFSDMFRKHVSLNY